MFKRSPAYLAIAAALAAPMMSEARDLGGIDVSVILKNETAAYIHDGPKTGDASSMLDNSSGHDAGDLMKFENSANVYLNGKVGGDATWHGQLNLIYDTEAIDGYKGHKVYTQNDYIRELYVDTPLGGWDARLGKQQVVWGTADGIKLLDIINPTDFRELNQNSMEDSRIPIWMANLERNVGERGNIQLIVAQPEENKIPGLNPDSDSGHPFIMKGVDTITGKVNGFYSIAPALSNVAATFTGAAVNGAFTGGFNGDGLNPFAALTVEGFAGQNWDTTGGVLTPDPNGVPGQYLLNNFAQNGFTGQPGYVGVDPNGNYNVTNLMPITGSGFFDVNWAPSTNPTSAFEYMSNATFATFNTFSTFDPTTGSFTGTKTRWKKEDKDLFDPNMGFRFRSYTDGGLNWTVNYFYHYSANPDIDLDWVNDSGQKLTVQRAATAFVSPTQGVPDLSTNLTRDQARANWNLGNPTTILVHDGSGNYYGALDPTAIDGNFTPGMGAPTLQFTESFHRVHSIGSSFDYALDLADVPVVLRGEFLYDKDDRQPVIDKYLLSIGDLTNALRMEEADYFKYVLGVDVTVMTNLLVSGQFIQFRNLDYVDKRDRCYTQIPGVTVDCSRYTGDFSTLSLSNGLQKAQKNKEFYSLFFSKPFGESQLGRWNNITIFEEGGGWWNRFDLEYSFTDQFIMSGELNLYWGDENTTFGQFEKSSSIQVGLKYIID